MVAVRLDVLVRKVLVDARERMEERAGAVVEAAPEFAARGGGGDGPRAGGNSAHPRSSSRRMAKKATGLDAKISMKR